IYTPLLKVLYPLVWVINGIANTLLNLVGVDTKGVNSHHLSTEELRTVVNEAGALIPKRHQSMLISILDLEKVTVEDIMIPRSEIQGIDLDADWADIKEQLTHSQHTRLPIYRDDIDNVVGVLHIRHVMHQMASIHDEFSKESLESNMREPYFIPEATPLNTQLLNFQRQERRIGLVVNEYGDIQGLVTLEDILEEIVGEFTSDPSTNVRDVHPQEDGSYLVDGSVLVRDLNKMLRWSLPIDGPKTLSGVIVEYLESIPEPGISIKIKGYAIEIVQIADNTVKTARIVPPKSNKQKVKN
ncbi:MAG: CBS domain-containing protein, partial [Gammaproteobacteria bacterium]|nr:CBS domain-containing protein [Gammaproteobacteria bacterium]